MKVNHITPINILDYPYHQKLKDDLKTKKSDLKKMKKSIK